MYTVLRFLRLIAVLAIFPLLAVCALTVKCFFLVVSCMLGVWGLQLAWPPTALVDVDAKAVGPNG
jgi:hypothetical protein